MTRPFGNYCLQWDDITQITSSFCHLNLLPTPLSYLFWFIQIRGFGYRETARIAALPHPTSQKYSSFLLLRRLAPSRRMPSQSVGLPEPLQLPGSPYTSAGSMHLDAFLCLSLMSMFLLFYKSQIKRSVAPEVSAVPEVTLPCGFISTACTLLSTWPPPRWN